MHTARIGDNMYSIAVHLWVWSYWYVYMGVVLLVCSYGCGPIGFPTGGPGYSYRCVPMGVSYWFVPMGVVLGVFL